MIFPSLSTVFLFYMFHVSNSFFVKPLILHVKTVHLDATLDEKLFLFNNDKSISDVEKIRQFVEQRRLSDTMRIQLLEYALNHVSSSPMRTLRDNDIYFSMNSENSSNVSFERISKAVELINEEKVFPSHIWTSESEPAFKIVLLGSEELISSRIREYGSFGPIMAVRDLVDSAKSARLQNLSSMNINAVGDIDGRTINTRDQSGVVIDVGANLGSISLYAASLGERVISFEPVPTLSIRLRASCILNGWCEDGDQVQIAGDVTALTAALQGLRQQKMLVLSAGVGNETGSSANLAYDWQGGEIRNSGTGSMHSVKDSRFLDSNRFGATGEYLTINVVTLDSVAAALGLIPASIDQKDETFDPIDILKLDCEGCEPQALQGATRIFEFNPPYAIITEANEERLLAGGWSTLTYLQEIERLGYDVFDMNMKIKHSPMDEEKVLSFDLFNKVHDFICLRRS